MQHNHDGVTRIPGTEVLPTIKTPSRRFRQLSKSQAANLEGEHGHVSRINSELLESPLPKQSSALQDLEKQFKLSSQLPEPDRSARLAGLAERAYVYGMSCQATKCGFLGGGSSEGNPYERAIKTGNSFSPLTQDPKAAGEFVGSCDRETKAAFALLKTHCPEVHAMAEKLSQELNDQIDTREVKALDKSPSIAYIPLRDRHGDPCIDPDGNVMMSAVTQPTAWESLKLVMAKGIKGDPGTSILSMTNGLIGILNNKAKNWADGAVSSEHLAKQASRIALSEAGAEVVVKESSQALVPSPSRSPAGTVPYYGPREVKKATQYIDESGQLPDRADSTGRSRRS